VTPGVGRVKVRRGECAWVSVHSGAVGMGATWNSGSATAASSFIVSWCHSRRVYRSAITVKCSASSGCAALCPFRYAST